MAAGRWYKLDNAAIIVPCSAHGFDTRVFRLSAELTEEVDPSLLAQALKETAPEFPHFNCALRKGLFWYYLDGLDEEPTCEEDHLPPMSPLYLPGRRNLLYHVTYYRRRINLEMFHVLADGTGAFVFLQKIVTRYLALRYGLQPESIALEDSSNEEKSDDAFARYYQKMKSDQLHQMTSVKAYQLHGEVDANQNNHIVEAVVSASEMKEAAKREKTTIGVLITSLYIQAVVDGMSVRDRRRPVVISVPVNLRNFFPSETVRNFFGVINISYDAKEYDGTLESILDAVAAQFKGKLDRSSVAAVMNSYSGLTENLLVKAVPLFVKEPCITWFLYRSQKGITATLSNIGSIHMPEQIGGYIDHFAAFMTAPNMQVTIATYKDKLCIGSCSRFVNHDVCLRLYRRLTQMGLSVTISSNDYDLPAQKEGE